MTVAEEDLAHLYRVYFEDLDLCGCNVPDEAWATIRDVLALCPLYDGGWREVERRFTAGGAHIVLGSLEHAGLIEHGGTIMGSWITPKGQWVLDRLGAVDGSVDDALDAVGYPHDGGPCPDDCPIGEKWRVQ